MVDSQTTDSITFSWALPEDMELNQYNFSVFSNNEDSLTQNNSITLQNLQSGTAYSISVATVGMLHYQSTVVMTQNYTSESDQQLVTHALGLLLAVVWGFSLVFLVLNNSARANMNSPCRRAEIIAQSPTFIVVVL